MFFVEFECVPEGFWGTLYLELCPCRAAQAGLKGDARPSSVPQVMLGPTEAARAVPLPPRWPMLGSGALWDSLAKRIWPGQS